MSILNQLHYQILGESLGSRPPLVFLHGLMGYGLNWKRIANAFQSSGQVLIFDQRGHGKSYHPETGYSPEDYADDLALLIDALGWETIDLVGHSMGGRNALNFAFRFPQRVRRFVMVDMGPEVAPGSSERIQALIDLVPVPFQNKLLAKEFFMNEFPKLIPQNPQSQTLGQYFYANMAEDEKGLVSWRFSLKAITESLKGGRSKNYWSEWEALTMPTLVIRGEKSEDLTSEIYLEMLKRNPLSRGVEVKGAGHWVHFDRPEKFTQILKRFLNFDESEILRQDFDFQESSD